MGGLPFSPQASAPHPGGFVCISNVRPPDQAHLAELKARRKEQAKHLQLKDLPEEQRIEQLRSARKHFMDTIKLIAYRAESALVQLVRESLSRHHDARSLVSSLMQTSMNLRPNSEAKELMVEIHGQANAVQDRVVEKICQELNAAETVYPGTDLVLKYITLRSPPFLRDQDV